MEPKIKRIEIWHPIDETRHNIVQEYDDDQVRFFTDGKLVACCPPGTFMGKMGSVRFDDSALVDAMGAEAKESEEALINYRKFIGQRISELETKNKAWNKAFDYIADELAIARNANKILRERLAFLKGD